MYSGVHFYWENVLIKVPRMSAFQSEWKQPVKAEQCGVTAWFNECLDIKLFYYKRADDWKSPYPLKKKTKMTKTVQNNIVIESLSYVEALHGWNHLVCAFLYFK